MSELIGSPVLREPALEWGPPQPEEHIDEIIDMDTTGYQVASTEDWWHRFDKVEEGLINRFFEAEQSKVDENGHRIRIQQYKEDFDKDPNGFFIQRYIAARKPEEWQAQLSEALQLLEKLQTLLTQDEGSMQQSLRGSLNLAGLGQKSGIGEEASAALATLLTTIAEGKRDTQIAKSKANRMISGLIDTQLVVQKELLAATENTRYEDLSEATRAFIFRQYVNFRYSFDEGTDRRTASLMTLMRMRKNSPFRVFKGRDRFVWQALNKGWDIIDQLKTENDPATRAKLEKELEQHKATVRKWTSSMTGTWDERDELGPIGILQAQSAAWSRIKGTINRFRDPSPDGRTPGKARRTYVKQHPTYNESSWEAQALESDIYLQFGTAWNSYRRLEDFTDAERQIFIDNFFNRQYKESYKERQKRLTGKIDEEITDIKNALEDLDAEIAELEKEVNQTTGTPAAPGTLSPRQQKIDDLKTRKQEIKTEIENLYQEYKNTGTTPAQQNQQQGNRNNNQPKGLTFEKYRSLRGELSGEEEKIDKEIDALEKEQAAARRQLEALKKERAKIVADHRWDQLYPDPTKPDDINQAELDLRKQQAMVDDNFRATTAANEKFRIFLNKLREFVNQDDLDKLMYDKFTNEEVQAISALTGVGAHKDKTSGQLRLGAGMTEYGAAKLKLKVKRHQNNDPNLPVLLDPQGNEIIDEVEIDDDYKADFNFLNLSRVPEWNGRLSVEATQQALTHPERYPKLAEFINHIKDPNNEAITIELSWPVRNDLDGGAQEEPAVHTGRHFKVDVAIRLKELHGWNNMQLYKAWLENPRIQDELGIRPEEMLSRMVSDRVRTHEWQRELLDGFTVVNVNNTTAVPTAGDEDAPLFLETMIMRQFDMYGRLSVEDVDGEVFYQLLPRTNEQSYTFNKKDGTREVHFRNRTITNSERAPQTDLDLLFESLMGQLRLYENRTRYYNNARRPMGSFSYDETIKIGAYIKAHMQLIEQKMMRLRAIYENPNANLTMAERIQMLEEFREKEMAHLSYEILDKRGRPKMGQRNKELWEHYNSTAQWLGKLKRNQREAEDRYVATLTNEENLHRQVNGVSAYELAEADYLYHKNERLRWEMEVYSLGLESTGQLNGLDNKEATALLSDRYADIDAEQFIRVNKKHFYSVVGADTDLGPSMFGMWGRRAVGRIATSFLADAGRRLGLRLNEIARTYGLNLNLPGDRFMLNVSPMYLEQLLVKKNDFEIFRRLAARTALGINTGYQADWLGIFQPNESNDIVKNVGATDFEYDAVGRKLFQIYRTRRRDDLQDALDRWLLMYGAEFLQDAKFSGMRIGEIINTINNARMNDTARLETNANGFLQLNPYGGQGTKMDRVDSLLLGLTFDRQQRPTAWATQPLDNRFRPVNTNTPTVIEQHEQAEAAKYGLIV